MPPRFAPSLTTQRSSGGSYTTSGQLQQLSEDVPELRWPNSNFVFDRMRKDGKCAAVLRAITMPPRRTGWHVVDSPDVRPVVATFVRNNLGLVEEGDSRRRRRGQGISWDPMLRHSLLNQAFGHMFFEPVFTLGPPGPNDVGLPPGTYAHLARLAPILPRTIVGMEVDPSGDLATIVQASVDAAGKYQTTPLDASLLLAVINDREGSDWAGTSVLRAAYKHWFLKDQLERLAFSIVERNGMGVPTAEYGPDNDRDSTLRLLTAFRAGDLSGAAFPAGANFKLAGVDGALVDPMPQIEYHGQEIARSVLAMFLDLGHDNGARALGETFVDFFTQGENALIADLEETYTEGLSRRLVELNFGPDEAYPDISAEAITGTLTADTIAGLVTAGVLHPDESLEDFCRSTFGIPPVTDEDLANRPKPPTVITLPSGVPVPGAPGASPVPALPPGTPPAPPPSGSKMSGETLGEAEARLARMRAEYGRRRAR